VIAHSASKQLWVFGLLLATNVWCDVEFLFLVFFLLLMVDTQFVVGDERRSLVMMDNVCVEKDLKDGRQ
jgi:hypothetical protein